MNRLALVVAFFALCMCGCSNSADASNPAVWAGSEYMLTDFSMDREKGTEGDIAHFVHTLHNDSPDDVKVKISGANGPDVTCVPSARDFVVPAGKSLECDYYPLVTEDQAKAGTARSSVEFVVEGGDTVVSKVEINLTQ